MMEELKFVQKLREKPVLSIVRSQIASWSCDTSRFSRREIIAKPEWAIKRNSYEDIHHKITAGLWELLDQFSHENRWVTPDGTYINMGKHIKDLDVDWEMEAQRLCMGMLWDVNYTDKVFEIEIIRRVASIVWYVALDRAFAAEMEHAPYPIVGLINDLLEIKYPD